MNNLRNAEVKKYICNHFVKETDDQRELKENAHKAGLPQIAIPDSVGKLIYMLAKLHQPKRILEIGTLAGYSTTWLAKAAPEAKIITLEYDPEHAEIARQNFIRLNLSDRIEVIEDDALISLMKLIQKREEPFDLIFLDADKEGYPAYLPLLLKLSRPGTLLLSDNLIPKEEKINEPESAEARSIYEYNRLLMSHPQIETILSPTIVGENGRTDALGISIIR